MGFPSTAEDYTERGLDLNRTLVGVSRSRVVLTLPGESLPELGIEPGALLVVDTAATAHPGAAVVCMIGDEWRLLRFAQGKRGPYLVEQRGDAWHRVVDEHARVVGVVAYSIGRLTGDSDGWAAGGFEPGVAYPVARPPW